MAPRALTALLAVLLAAAGLVAEHSAETPSLGLAVADYLVGIAFLTLAIVLARRSRQGALLCLATAAAWYAATLSTAPGGLGQVGTVMVLVYRAPLVHFIALPLRSKAIKIVVVAGYLGVLAPAAVAGPITVLLAGLVCVLGIGIAVRQPLSSRRAPVVNAVIAGTLATIWTVGMRAALPGDALAVVLDLALVVCAVGVAMGNPSAWATANRILIDLGPGHSTMAPVAAVLARELGVPSLRLYYREPGGDWIDELGVRAASPPQESVVVDSPDGGELALVGCPPETSTTEVVKVAAATAALAFADARALARRREQTEAIRASRRRLLEVADSERWAIRSRVQQGPLERLTRLRESTAHHRDTPGVNDFLDELDTAVAELIALTEGLYPDVVSTGSVRDLIQTLADRFEPRAAVTISGHEGRLDRPQRALVYFVCAECLTNAARYAPRAATRVDLVVSDVDLRLQVSDDGPGGATVSSGRGLQGLSDRLQTAGGQLFVRSPVGGPTNIIAELPLLGLATADRTD